MFRDLLIAIILSLHIIASQTVCAGTPNNQRKEAGGKKETTKAFKDMGSFSPQVVTILHFNDVYNIEERDQEPRGGAARFVTAVKSVHELNPMVLFSGDAFAPSISKTYKLRIELSMQH